MGTAKEMVSNIPGSAVRAATDIVQPFIHPVETYESFKNLGMGLMEKMGISKGEEHTKYADALGQWLSERYGSVEAAKKTLREDPVGLAMDASMIFSGGGSALARAPGVVGKVGEVASTVGRTIDPVRAASKAVMPALKLGAEVVGGLGTHTGAEPIAIAARSGFEGGSAGQSFRENMRAKVPSEEAAQAAQLGLEAMVKERGDVYRAEMAKLGLDKKVMDFTKIDDAILKSLAVKRFGAMDLSPRTSGIRKEMTQAIQEWKMLPPDVYHTAEGLDALKRKLGEMYEATEYGTAERKVARDIYNGVRQTIIDEFPEYKRVMEGYEDASKIINQMEKTLSLNPNASIDTKLRKLQSVLRNNVNTSYSHRRELADFLVRAGAPHLMEKLAGQALQPMLPRGIGRLGAMIGAELTGLGEGHLGKFMFAAPFMSPRTTGEIAHFAGRVARPLSKIPGRPAGQALYQSGRMYDIMQKRMDEDRRRNLYRSTD